MKAEWVKLVRAGAASKHERRLLASLAGRLHTSRDVARLVGPRLAHELTEVVLVIALDGQNHCRAMVEISRGGLHGSSLSVADVFRVPIVAGATGVIMAHNHPSGVETPSDEDRRLTEAVAAAGLILGLQLLDHLVITADPFTREIRHASMRDLDLIP